MLQALAFHNDEYTCRLHLLSGSSMDSKETILKAMRMHEPIATMRVLGSAGCHQHGG